MKSVKDRFEVGDLIGFRNEPNDDYISEFGKIVPGKSKRWFRIKWDDGMISRDIPDSTDAMTPMGCWINFGPDSENNRLLVTLKYFKSDE